MDDDKITGAQNQSVMPPGDQPVFTDPSADHPQPIAMTASEPPVQIALDQPPAATAPTAVVTDNNAMMPEEAPPDEMFPPPPPEAFDSGFGTHRTKFFFIGGAILFFFIIFGLILALIFGSSRSKAVNVKLTYWGLWEEQQTLQPIIDQYQKDHKGVTITYVKMESKEYRDKILARSKTEGGPDIFDFHNTWIPEVRDVVSPLPSSVMSNADFEKTFYSVAQKDLKIGNAYYGIPLYIDGLVLAYNDGLFKKAGISTPPTTWEDVLNYVSKLTVKDSTGKIVTSGIALGTASNVEHFSDIFLLFLIQNGADIKKLDQPEAASALEAYRKFAEGDGAVWDESMPNSVTAFIQEKVAMMIVPSWHLLPIKQQNPQLALKVVGVPVIPDTKPVSLASYWVEGVSKYSKNQVEAWKFLKYLSEADTMTKMYELQTRARPFGNAYSRVDLGSKLAGDPYLGAVIKQAPDYVSVPGISRTYDNGLDDAIAKYIENAINQTISGVDYASALSTAAQGVAQQFTQFKIQ